MTPTRRTVCTAALGAAAALLTGCGTGRYRGHDREIRIAAGQKGGFYLQVAGLLAREINAAEPGLHCRALRTNGSVENITMVNTGEADIAVCQSDAALAAVLGTSPFAGALPVTGIGRMYEDYLQLVVRADSEVTSVADLAGRTVSLGAPGSGTAMIGERLMAAAKVRVNKRLDPLDDAVALVADRRADALLWSGGVPTPSIADLHREEGIRLLPLTAMLPALRARYRMAYQAVTIPAGGYGHAAVSTIGVANLLVCGRSVPDDVVSAITGVLVEHAARLVPPLALGTQFLDRRALINLLGVPMHPGAVSAYRQLHG
jgi:TRAP transporter TAXI family solute receptor